MEPSKEWGERILLRLLDDEADCDGDISDVRNRICWTRSQMG